MKFQNSNTVSRVVKIVCAVGLMAAMQSMSRANEPVFSKFYQARATAGWGSGSLQTEDDTRFWRIESSNAGRNTLAHERIQIPERLRGQTVTLHAQVRADNIAQASPPRDTAKFLLQREGPGGSTLGWGVMHPETDGQWHTVSWTRELEDNIESIKIDMGLFSCLGRLDVRALVMMEGEAPAPDWDKLGQTVSSEARWEVIELWPHSDRLDVTAEPFNADPTGERDSTAAIQMAIDRAVHQLRETPTGLSRSTQQVLFFPAGTYRVSETLTLRANRPDDLRASQVSFVGEGPGRSVLRLSDHTPAFQSGRVPVLMFLEGNRSNVAHQNEVMDLAIDVGVGNPGAVALQFISNNVGTVRRVVLKSSDPDGAGNTGLWLRRNLGGQALIHHLEVHGFDIGIDVRHPISAYTFENILLKNQNEVGLSNDRKAIAIHRLRSENRVPAIRNTHREGLVTLLSSELLGGSPDAPAIDNRAGGFSLREVRVEGYGMAVNNRGREVHTLPEGLWTSDEPVGLGDMPDFLPVKDTPEVPVAAEADTFRVDTAYIEAYLEANEGAQEVDAIQAAIDSGKTDIVFERIRFNLHRPVIVRGNVRRLDMNYGATRPREAYMQNEWRPMFILEDTNHPVLLLERFGYNFSHGFRYYHIQNNRSQALIIRDSMFAGGSHIYRNEGAGDLFLENVFSIFRVANFHTGIRRAPDRDLPGKPAWLFLNQNVWARQFNVERDTRGYGELLATHTVVDGGAMWVMGYKSGEFDGPYLGVRNGGRLEFWGGFVNTISGEHVEGRAMFVNEGGTMLISGVERSSGQINHPIVLKHADGEQILHADFPHRRGDQDGIIFPLIYSSLTR